MSGLELYADVDRKRAERYARRIERERREQRIEKVKDAMLDVALAIGLCALILFGTALCY